MDDFLEELISGIQNKDDTEFYPMYCTCSRQDCFGFMLLNNHMLQRSIDGGFNPNTHFIHLPITELHNHVKELKLPTMKNGFEIIDIFLQIL